MKPLLVLAVLAHSALACPAPPEYPKGKPFLECPYKMTTLKVELACDKPGNCIYGTRQIWHYKMSEKALLAEWAQFLKQAGWSSQLMNPVGSKGVPSAWIRATKGTTTWDTYLDSDGTGSTLAFLKA